MFEFIASIFGYILEFLYNLVNNYGLAIILFTIVIKVILLPMSIKQQKSMKKNAKLQEKMKAIQFKYKNDQEKLNKEVMELYKTEKMGPFSGCITAIVQLLLLISIFYLVRNPITYMAKISNEDINNFVEQVQEDGREISSNYPQIDLIKEYNWLKERNSEDENVDKLDIQMNFLGLDLGKIPQQNMSDYKVYIIPILYIISSFISIRLTTSMQEKTKKDKKVIIDGETGLELDKKEEPANEMDTMMQTNKMMSWMMPIMSISIAFVAPLGLALYWLVNNILMIIERLAFNKFLKTEEE